MTHPIETPGGAARRKAGRLAAVFALCMAAPLGAQTLSGHVLGTGGRPVASAAVELHRVTRSERGIVQRTRSDAAGAFQLTLPAAADSGFTVHFATAVVNGVRYFGPALHGGEAPARYVIEVSDTTSSAAAADSVQVRRRDVILSAADGGGWEVAELVTLRNPTRRTLVPDRDRPVVGLELPAGSIAFQAGEGESSAPAGAPSGDLVRVGDRAWVSAPFVPGEREFVFRYRLPASPRRVQLRLGRATDSLTVYVRQPAPDAEVTGIPEGEAFTAEGERFRRWAGASLTAGAEVALDWRGPAPAPVDPRWAALALAALVLAAGGWLAWRRPTAR